MKKRIAILLAIVLCVASLSACNNKSNTGDADAAGDVEQAKAYLVSMYEKSPEITASDYEVVSMVTVAGVKYNVTWTTDAADVKVITSHHERLEFL